MICPGANELTDVLDELRELVQATEGLVVRRRKPARSSKPFPTSEDLEVALIPTLGPCGFQHHEKLRHPREAALGFEYDFWRPADGVAMEVMGYRADDEVYKDLLKFHVHERTTVGVLWVPRYKWISGKRTDTNFRAAVKAVTFADTFMNVNALVILPYDWQESDQEDCWVLHHVNEA